MTILAIVLLAAIVPAVLWGRDLAAWWEGRPVKEIKAGVAEILATYLERTRDPARSAFPVRPAVVAGFERAFSSTLRKLLENAGVDLEGRRDFQEEISSVASHLAKELSREVAAQAASDQSAG